MQSLRARNRLPDEYRYADVMQALADNGHRMSAGPHTMVTTTRSGHGFRVIHYDTEVAVVYSTYACVSTGGHTGRATADRLQRVLQQFGWDALIATGSRREGIYFSHFGSNYSQGIVDAPTDQFICLRDDGQYGFNHNHPND